MGSKKVLKGDVVFVRVSPAVKAALGKLAERRAKHGVPTSESAIVRDILCAALQNEGLLPS